MNETSLPLYKKCCISLHRLGNQYICVCLQINHPSVAGLNFGENLIHGRSFSWNWRLLTDEKWHYSTDYVFTDGTFVHSVIIHWFNQLKVKLTKLYCCYYCNMLSWPGDVGRRPCCEETYLVWLDQQAALNTEQQITNMSMNLSTIEPQSAPRHQLLTGH